MKAEIKQKWLEALRSGKYQQGRQALRNRDQQFCCLGVLCDVVDDSKWNVAFPVGNKYEYGDHADSARTGYPPLSFRERVGLLNKDIITLADMNDGHSYDGAGRKSFAEIADWIEQNVSTGEGE